MGKNTKIPWATHSYNPWVGCTRKSQGCDRCYAQSLLKRFGKEPTVITRASEKTFHSPLSWRKPGERVFVCSMSDFFHSDVPLEWRAEAWDIMRKTPHLTYLILTKRPENIASMLPPDWLAKFAHVWLGVTIESQDYVFDNRGEVTSVNSDGTYGITIHRNSSRLKIIENIRNVNRYFISCEPLLDDVEYGFHLYGYPKKCSWCIVGGESGPNARRMDLNWVRSLRDMCVENNIPFFFKQQIVNGKKVEMPELDGVVWDQVPISMKINKQCEIFCGGDK